MITCQHAKHLFDGYLDGELSSSLQAELHAHQLNCSSCQSELAILEACGDVIAGDKPEPVLSASFTDRVMSARRVRVQPQRRRWARTLLVFGSPVAAAASIVLAVIVLQSPSAVKEQQPRAVVAGGKVAVPQAVQKTLLGNRELSPEVRAALASTPEMNSVGFVQDWLEPVMAQTRSTFQMAQSGVEQMEVLLRLGASDANKTLMDRWQSMQQGKAAEKSRENRSAHEMNLLDPASPGSVTPSDQPSSEPKPTQPFDAL